MPLVGLSPVPEDCTCAQPLEEWGDPELLVGSGFQCRFRHVQNFVAPSSVCLLLSPCSVAGPWVGISIAFVFLSLFPGRPWRQSGFCAEDGAVRPRSEWPGRGVRRPVLRVCGLCLRKEGVDVTGCCGPGPLSLGGSRDDGSRTQMPWQWQLPRLLCAGPLSAPCTRGPCLVLREDGCGSRLAGSQVPVTPSRLAAAPTTGQAGLFCLLLASAALPFNFEIKMAFLVHRNNSVPCR